MKISCQSCQAKYTIADEKVLGKIVKIRCKKCGATIVINGNEAAAHPAQDQNDTNVYDYTQQQSGEQWTVNVADGDQRTMGLAEMVSNFRGGVLNEETYIWKDGMSDWLPIREVAEVFSAVQMGPRPSLHQEPSVPPPAVLDAHEHQQHQQMGALFGPSSTQDAPTEEVAAARNGNGPAPLFGEAPPAAARRQGGRGAGGADLFGGVAAAGGEQDVMTSAASGEEAPKMTGARNENSVLFSLSALTSEPKPAENKTTASGDGSGLIDIRALSATMGAEDSKKNKQTHVDDIMNLGGGGAFGAALAAPVLAPPPMEAVDTTGAAGGGKSKGLMFGLLGLGAFLFAGIIVAVLLLRGGSTTPSTTGPGATSTTPTATATMSVAANDTATAPTNTGGSSGSSGSDTTPATTSTAKAVSTGTSAMKAGTTPTHAAANTGGGATTSAPVIPPAPTNTGGGGGGSLAEQLAKAAGANTGGGATTSAPAAAAAPFDRGAAAAALGGVNVAGCKKPDGPTGTGHVTVTFAPSGNVTSAVVDSPPFAGTPVGGCVAGKFRGAHVPAFSGGNVTVGKSFSLN